MSQDFKNACNFSWASKDEEKRANGEMYGHDPLATGGVFPFDQGITYEHRSSDSNQVSSNDWQVHPPSSTPPFPTEPCEPDIEAASSPAPLFETILMSRDPQIPPPEQTGSSPPPQSKKKTMGEKPFDLDEFKAGLPIKLFQGGPQINAEDWSQYDKECREKYRFSKKNQCPYCPYSTGRKDDYLNHFGAQHVAKSLSQSMTPPLASSSSSPSSSSGHQASMKKRKMENEMQGTSPLYLEADTPDDTLIMIKINQETHRITARMLLMLSRVEGPNKDFAEYFVSNPADLPKMTPGTVVNLISGKASLDGFEKEDFLFRIVTTDPLVLGNSTADNSGKVALALLGQVPVNLPRDTKASPGNYICVGESYLDIRVEGHQGTGIPPRAVGLALEHSRLVNEKNEVMVFTLNPFQPSQSPSQQLSRQLSQQDSSETLSGSMQNLTLDDQKETSPSPETKERKSLASRSPSSPNKGKPLGCLAVSNDGLRTAVSYQGSKYIDILNERGEFIARLKGPWMPNRTQLNQLLFWQKESLTVTFLIAIGSNGLIYFWDIGNQNVALELSKNTEQANMRMYLDKEQKRLFVVKEKGMLHIWDLGINLGFQKAVTVKLFESEEQSLLQFNPSNEEVILGCKTGVFFIPIASPEKNSAIYSENRKALYSMSPNGKYLAACFENTLSLKTYPFKESDEVYVKKKIEPSCLLVLDSGALLFGIGTRVEVIPNDHDFLQNPVLDLKELVTSLHTPVEQQSIIFASTANRVVSFSLPEKVERWSYQ